MARTRVVSVGVLVAFSVFVAACGGSSGDGDAKRSGGSKGASSSAGAIGRGEELTPRELTDALAAVGIATYAKPGDADPVVDVDDPGPMAFTSDQVNVFSLESRDATGTTGAQLDSLVDPVDDGAPFSLVVAAYVKSGDTDGAELARRLMGEQPWAQSASLVFPDVVLAVFANDVAMEASAAGHHSAHRMSDGVTGVCSQLAGWVDSVISTISDALKVDTSGGGVTGLLGDIWNTVVDLALEAGATVVKTLTGPVAGAIQAGLAIAGTVSMAAGLLRPWSVSATQEPDPVPYGIEPGSGNAAKIVATVDVSGSEPFSAGVIDCAQQAGVPLPNPSEAKGSAITWTPVGIDAVGTDISHDDTIGADDTASLRYTTKTESKDAATKGDPVPHTVAVTVEVERTQIKDIQKVLQTILTGTVPGVVGEITSAVLGIITQPIFDELATMLGTANAGTGTVISHTEPDEPDPTTTSSPADECEGLAEGTIPDGTWTGPIELGVDGSSSGAAGTVTSTGSGTMTITVAKGKVTGGTWSLQFSSTGTMESDGAKATIDSMTGSVSGSVDGPATAPHQSGQYSISGEIAVSVSGFNTTVPIDESGGTEATLTVEQSDCSAVSGTFIPSFNAATGGYAMFSGVARWSGEAA